MNKELRDGWFVMNFGLFVWNTYLVLPSRYRVLTGRSLLLVAWYRFAI
jgi:hypothetical protein